MVVSVGVALPDDLVAENEAVGVSDLPSPKGARRVAGSGVSPVEPPRRLTYISSMSDVEHKVVELVRDSVSTALEAELHRHEKDGWELAATMPNSDGSVSLIFKRPRPLFEP